MAKHEIALARSGIIGQAGAQQFESAIQSQHLLTVKAMWNII